MQITSVQDLHPDILFNIFQYCQELDALALVSREFYFSARNQNLPAARRSTFCRNIYQGTFTRSIHLIFDKIKDAYSNAINDGVLLVYTNPSKSEFKAYKITKSLSSFRKVFEFHYVINQQSSCLQINTNERSFTQLIVNNYSDIQEENLVNTRFSMCSMTGNFSFHSELDYGEFNSQLSYSISLVSVENSRGIAIFEKTLKHQGLNYTFMESCETKGVSKVFNVIKIFSDDNEINAQVLEVPCGPINGLAIIHSFLFVLVKGEILIYNRYHLGSVGKLDVTEYKCKDIVSDETKGMLYALTESGIVTYEFSKFENKKITTIKIVSLFVLTFLNVLFFGTNDYPTKLNMHSFKWLRLFQLSSLIMVALTSYQLDNFFFMLITCLSILKISLILQPIFLCSFNLRQSNICSLN